MEVRELPAACCFGTEGMKRLKVCPRCGGLASAHLRACPDCGGRLPRSNLFQLYQQNHRLCPECDTVLSDGMRFCLHCGTKITIQKFSEKREEMENEEDHGNPVCALPAADKLPGAGGGGRGAAHG